MVFEPGRTGAGIRTRYAQICVGLITALIVHIVLYYKCSDFGKLRTREGFDLLDEI